MSDVPLIGRVRPPALHLMTFNLRRRIPHLNRLSPDRWARRRLPVRRLLIAEQPTLLGVQEGLADQLAEVGSALGARYRWIGSSVRSRGGGEHCAVFYDASRLRLVQWHQQALSDTPEVPGSATWGNWQPRAVVAGTFADRATGAELVVLSTHLDPLSPRSRLRSAEMIRALAAPAGRPTVVLGDFNTGPGSEAHRRLTQDGALRDSWLVASEHITEAWGTYPRYRRPRRGGKRIDWILATPSVEILQGAVNVTRYDGAWPSDHAPVHAVVRCREAGHG